MLAGQRGGIYVDSTNATEMNHDVEVVGWGEENGLKYFTHSTTRTTAQHSGVGDSEVWTSLLIANNLFPPASAPLTFEDGTNQGKSYQYTYATRESYATIYAPPAPRLVCVELNMPATSRLLLWKGEGIGAVSVCMYTNVLYLVLLVYKVLVSKIPHTQHHSHHSTAQRRGRQRGVDVAAHRQQPIPARQRASHFRGRHEPGQVVPVHLRHQGVVRHHLRPTSSAACVCRAEPG